MGVFECTCSFLYMKPKPALHVTIQHYKLSQLSWEDSELVPHPPVPRGEAQDNYGRETTRNGEVKLPRDAIRAVGKKSINENLQPPYVQTVRKARGKGGPTTPDTRSRQKLVQQMETGKAG